MGDRVDRSLQLLATLLLPLLREYLFRYIGAQTTIADEVPIRVEARPPTDSEPTGGAV